MHKLNKILTLVPVVLFLSVVAFNFLFTYLNLNDDSYIRIYYTANEMLGAPLVTNLFLLGACYRYKLCMYNKVSVLGLLLLNVINLLAINTALGEYQYYNIVTQVAIVPVCALALILLIKKI